MVFSVGGGGNVVRESHLVSVGTVDAIEGVIVHSCVDEDELLRTFRTLVIEKDPDFVVAYNGVNFDNRSENRSKRCSNMSYILHNLLFFHTGTWRSVLRRGRVEEERRE